MNINCINFNNKIYIIKRNHNENNQSFIERMWFIVSQINLKENKYKTYQDIVNLSNIYINEIKNKCIY
jgi:hypothetical protein